jgi:YVTN family beta-propeller protein
LIEKLKIYLFFSLTFVAFIILFSTIFIIESQASLKQSLIERLQKIDNASIRVGNAPTDITINPITNRIYVTNSFSNLVTVIDGKTNQIIANIPVGKNPHNINVDLVGRVYVANLKSNSISVIDDITNTVISEISINSTPEAIKLNDPFNLNVPNQNVFVLTPTNIYRIYDHNSKPEILFEFPKEYIHTHYGLDIYHYGKRNNDIKLFITNYNDSSISIITLPTREVKSIFVGENPHSIAFNDRTNKVYVTLHEKDLVSVIDLNNNNNKNPKYIRVGDEPTGISIDKDTNFIYVANSISDTITRINGTVDKTVGSVRSLTTPYELDLNPLTKILYVTQLESSTISALNLKNLKPVIALNFNINPIGSGQIACQKPANNNDNNINKVINIIDNYTIIDKDTTIECNAKPNSGFTFSSWSGNNMVSNQTNPLRFIVSDYGTKITANFGNALTLSEYQNTILAIIGAYLGIITAIPTIIQLHNLFKRKK